MQYRSIARVPCPISLRPSWHLQHHMVQRLDTNLCACLPYIVVAMTANFADSILTSIGLHFGCTEANPVASPLLSSTVCIFFKQLFIPVVAILGGLLLTPTLYRIAAKSLCLLLATVAALNLCTLTTGHSFLPETGNTEAYTGLSWFIGVYASMAVAFVVAFVHDHLVQLRTGRGRP
jgi:hypothetical protein